MSEIPPPTGPSDFDPVCLVHGKKFSEHDCLYCCLCFSDLKPEDCHVDAEGHREDVCEKCAAAEAICMAALDPLSCAIPAAFLQDTMAGPIDLKAKAPSKGVTARQLFVKIEKLRTEMSIDDEELPIMVERGGVLKPLIAFNLTKCDGGWLLDPRG